MLWILWLLIPRSCFADTTVTIHHVFDVHEESCKPHYEQLDSLFADATRFVKDGSANLEFLTGTPSVDPLSPWFQQQEAWIRASMEFWQVSDPSAATWILHNMRMRLAWLLFGTTYDEEDLLAHPPGGEEPQWFGKNPLTVDDEITLSKVRAMLQLLHTFLSAPKNDGRVFLACSQDAYIPYRVSTRASTGQRNC